MYRMVSGKLSLEYKSKSLQHFAHLFQSQQVYSGCTVFILRSLCFKPLIKILKHVSYCGRKTVLFRSIQFYEY